MKTLTKMFLDDYEPRPPKVLYHYCSVRTMLSILDNSCIWLSDSIKANDKTEMIGIFTYIVDAFNAILSIYDDIPDDIKNLFSSIIRSYANDIVSNHSQSPKKRYIACFSEDGDLLSQWRGYSNDGQGVAIGFRSKYFKSFSNRESYEFTKVIYKEELAKKFVYKTLEHNLLPILKAFKNYLPDNIEKWVNEMFLSLNMTLLLLIQESYLYKNSHFREEREWRLLRYATESNFDESGGVDDYGYADFLEGLYSKNSDHMGVFTRSELKYIATQSDLKSHLEIDFSAVKSKIISEIILGPKCKINPIDLKVYLAQRKYLEHYSHETISIYKSKTPYV